MDFGSPPKTAAVTGVPVVARSDASAQPGSVAVDLPPEQTVQSASAGGAVKLDIRPESRRQAQFEDQAKQAAAAERRAAAEQARESSDRRVVIEQNTHSIVVQERDPQTGETVNMVPDEATLKLRVFARALAEQKNAQPLPGQAVAVTA